MSRSQASVLTLLGLLLVLFWLAPEVPLLGFAAVLLALALRAGAEPLSRLTRLPEWAAVLVVAALVLLAIGLAGWFAAGPLTAQAQQLAKELPRSLETLRNTVAGTGWGEWVLQQVDPSRLMGGGGVEGAAAAAASAASSTLGGLGNAVLVILLALYLAVRPEEYLKGLRHLFAPELNEEMRATFAEAGTTLRGWLLGQAIGMIVAGTLTWIGLMLLGVPLAGLLGTIIAVLNFIPVIGPMIGAVPAVLLALTQAPRPRPLGGRAGDPGADRGGEFPHPHGAEPHRRPAPGPAAGHPGADRGAVRSARRGAGRAAFRAGDGAGAARLYRGLAGLVAEGG